MLSTVFAIDHLFLMIVGHDALDTEKRETHTAIEYYY